MANSRLRTGLNRIAANDFDLRVSSRADQSRSCLSSDHESTARIAVAMREEIKRVIHAATPGMSQQLYSTLLVLGELLSNALDRVDELEKKVDSQTADKC
jgi:hypothetical protein